MIKIGSFGGFSVNFYVNGVLFRVSYPGFGSQAADTFRLARGYSMTFADKTVAQISDAYDGFDNLDGVTITIDEMTRVIAQQISEYIDTNFE